MTEKSSSRIWLFLVLVIAVILMAAGLGYYLFVKNDVEPEQEPIVTSLSLPSVTEPKETVPEVAHEEPSGPVERRAMPEEEPLEEERPPSQDQCQKIERDIQDFFRYLDNQKYVMNVRISPLRADSARIDQEKRARPARSCCCSFFLLFMFISAQ